MDFGCESISPAASAAALSWVLPETLQRLALDGDREIVAEVIAAFESDTARRLRLLNEAISRHDRVALRAQAHAIKGASVEVGAERLAGVCQTLELAAMSDAPWEFADLLREAETAFQAVCRLMGESGWAAAR
jgi:two-component system sensor histidine kinase RpfC